MHSWVVTSIACAALLSGCRICGPDQRNCGSSNEPTSYPADSSTDSGGTSPSPPWTDFEGADCARFVPGDVDDRLTCAGLKPGAPWPTNGRCGDRASSTPLVAVEPTKQRWTIKSGPISLDVDDVAYVAPGDHVESFAADGSLRWRSESWEVLAGEAFPPPTIAPDGRLYALAHSRLHAVCPDGHRRWTVRLASNQSAALTNGNVIVSGSTPSGEWGLFAVDMNGQKVWSSSGFTIAEPTVSGSGLLFATTADTLFAMRSTAELAWKTPLAAGGYVAAIGADGSPVLLEPNAKGELAVVSRTAEGAIRWSYSVTDRRVLGVSIGADGTTLLTTQNLPGGDTPAQLVSLASDGSERFRVDLGAGSVAPALVDGAGTTIVVVGRPARVVAIDTHGSIAWSFALDDAPDDAEPRAILGSQGLYVTARGYTTALAH
ncbi:MAG: hypothetical protein ACXVEF_42795 [Polyangiales bacterium]